MKKFAALISSVLLASLISGVTLAQQVGYVSDVIHVPVRSGAGTQYRIVHAGLRSGTQVQVQEVEGDWSRIVTDGGLEGWMETQYLANEPPARSQLIQVEQRLASTRDQNAKLTARVRELEQENGRLQTEVAQLEQTAAEVTEELGEVRALSSDAINLNRRHRELLEQHQILQTDIDTLRAENDRLKNDATVDKWLYGAGLVLFGVFLSIVIPALKPKKRFSEWG